MTNLPSQRNHFVPSTGIRLLIQGVMLHVATIAGPLDVARKKGQQGKAAMLFISEYGLNLLLLALLQLVIYLFAPNSWLVGEVAAVSFLLFLSIVQMFVDCVRKPIGIYHSSKYEAGISVRVEGDNRWAFFNHYALPVGRKHGVHLREELHRQAQQRQLFLYCYAQNMDVASYYLREHPLGELVAGNAKRPLLVWDYRADEHKNTASINERAGKLDLFGLHSARTSGSLPM